MKRGDYTDGSGRRWATWIPDDETDASLGIVIGPQPLDALGLKAEIELRLHNELHARGVLTAKDLRTRRQEAVLALQAALRLDVQALERAWAVDVAPPPVDPGESVGGHEDVVERWAAQEAEERGGDDGEERPQRQRPERRRR